jgi:hypothetical protein
VSESEEMAGSNGLSTDLTVSLCFDTPLPEAKEVQLLIGPESSACPIRSMQWQFKEGKRCFSLSIPISQQQLMSFATSAEKDFDGKNFRLQYNNSDLRPEISSLSKRKPSNSGNLKKLKR